MKCNRCDKESHHTHHKDGNHKNNKPENIERLCTICHAIEHGIEPKMSELRKLVVYYEKVQKTKVAIQLSLNGFERMELDSPTELQGLFKQLKSLEYQFKKDIVKYLKENPVIGYEWMISIKGIGEILAGKILSRIDFEKTKSFASLWAYAGLSPDSQRQCGKKANWNHLLKRDCYQLVDSFIKQRTPKYREIYDKEKEKHLAREEIRTIHAHNRAIRKVAKVFLRNLFLEQRRYDHP